MESRRERDTPTISDTEGTVVHPSTYTANGTNSHIEAIESTMLQRLRASEERYRSLIAATAQIVWTTGVNGRIIGDMSSWCRYTGQDPQTIDSDAIMAAIHPDDREQVRHIWLDAVKRKAYYETSYRLRRYDGVYRTFSARGVPVFGDDGSLQEWIGACTDITEQQHLEEHLRESERRFRLTFEQVAVGIAHVALDGRWLLVNQRLCDFFGYSHEELLTLSFQEVTYPDDLAEDMAQVERTLAGEIQEYTMEKRYIRKDGTILWGYLKVSLVRDSNGKPDYFISVIEDISARKKAEEERRQLLEREQAARTYAEAVFDTIADGIFVYDAQGNIIQGNATAREIFTPAFYDGYLLHQTDNRAQIMVMRDEHGNLLAHDQLPIVRILHGETLKDGQTMDVIMNRPDGVDIYLSVSGAPLYDAEQHIIGAVTVFRDVTERRKLEQSERVAAQAAAEHARRLEAIFAAITDIVGVYNNKGELIYLSPSSHETFASDLASDTYRDIPLEERLQRYQLRDEHGRPLPYEQWPQNRVLRGEVITGEQALDVLMHIADGRELQYSMTGAPMYDADGTISGAVLISRNVTARRQLEQRTHDALTGLLNMAESLVQLPGENEQQNNLYTLGQQLAQLMKNVLDCQRVGVQIVDAATRRILPVAVLGLSPEQEPDWWAEQEQQSSTLDDSPTPELVEQLRKGKVLSLNMQEPPFNNAPNPYNVQVMLVAPMCIKDQLVGLLTLDYDGKEHQYTENELALASAVGKLSALIFERERLLRERADAQGREVALREAKNRMEEFLGVASHELRTPMTTIKANIQLAQRRLNRFAHMLAADTHGTIEATQEMLSRAERQVNVLNRLVGDMLDISRIQRDKLQLHIRPESYDLTTLVYETVHEQRKTVPGRVIELELPNETLLIHADPDRISQVLSNYITNALKYSTPDAPILVQLTKEWSVGDTRSGEHTRATFARVSVTDHGPGLPPEEQQRIWEVFYQAEGIKVQSGSGVGLGLGLHISKTIIERHGGDVGVISHPSDGSTFWFTLPLASA